MVKSIYFRQCIIFLGILLFLPVSLSAADKRMELSKGQRIYTPAYSHIYSGDKERPFLLTVTLSIRNIDPTHLIKITSVNYNETQGKLLKRFVDKPVSLRPLEALRYIIPERDKRGGSGANFIVEWQSDKRVNRPIIEAIMIGTQSTQGLSFTSRGREIFTSD